MMSISISELHFQEKDENPSLIDAKRRGYLNL